MQANSLEHFEKKIKSITYRGMAVNCALAIIKIIIGKLSGSLSLVADGIHSFSDLLTDIMVIFGVMIGSKKADYDHPYGHGRAETFASGFIALILTIVGGAMIYAATVSIAKDKITEPHITVLIAALISIVAKEWLYKATKKIAILSHSSSLYANAWHHRSDSLSSVAVLVGFIALEFGFGHGDQVAAIAVGLMIIFVAVHIISDTFRELTEGAADSETIKQIEQTLRKHSDIRQWHKLRTRTVGREIFVDVHILVDPELNVSDAHEITEALEKTLKEQIKRPINIIIHIEPDLPELRK